MNRPAWRDLDGILLLDKPAGLSSNRALQQARRVFRARKAGHTGTLDPFATGLLAVCFGQATKFSGFLLEASKHYRVRCRLGQRTDTGDPEGEVVEESAVPDLDAAAIDAALAEFTGPIDQVPPMHSALKHQGQRLYKLARRGEAVPREPRRVTIHDLTRVRHDGAELELAVHCSKGTYIRVLVEDLARRLGTVAHATALRRTAIHPFEDQPLVTFEALAEAEDPDGHLLPVDAALVDLSAVALDAESAGRLCHGQAVPVAADGPAGEVRVYGPGGRFLGVGDRSADGTLRPRRLMAGQ